MDWRPSASIADLKKRARIMQQIRAFFYARGVMEVETPLLAEHAVTDPALVSFSTEYQGAVSKTLYLQTSPEYAMKRLLAAGSGDIFQISKAFRNEERGRWHNPEFSLLEWYRVGFNHHQLMDEMDDLLQSVLSCKAATRLSYQTCFETYLQINPHSVSLATIKTIAKAKGIDYVGDHDDITLWLDLLLTHIIEPQLAALGVVFLYDYPKEQAALAKLSGEGHDCVAERFEVYVNGLELANGFHELTSQDQQRARFLENNAQRERDGLALVALDERLLQCLDHLPACAGVALGLDRLMALAIDAKDLDAVLSFAFANVNS